MFWKYIPPPFVDRKPITLPKGAVPIGAKYTGSNVPSETIQQIGETDAEVPESVSVDLGVADVYITDYGKKIEFAGKGLQTNVGSRIKSTVKGMSIPAGGDGISRPDMTQVYPAHSISRSAMPKEAPPRVRRVEEDELSDERGERGRGLSRPEVIKSGARKAKKPKKFRPVARGRRHIYFDEDEDYWESLRVDIGRRPSSGKKKKPPRRGKPKSVSQMGGLR